MKRILMALVVAVMLIGPVSSAAPITTDQSKTCKSSTCVVNMFGSVSKIIGSYDKCLKAGNSRAKETIVNVTKLCPRQENDRDVETQMQYNGSAQAFCGNAEAHGNHGAAAFSDGDPAFREYGQYLGV